MALKDKLMTLEDFKAVRDVDVASNSAQFTEIKADLANATEESPIDFFARDIFNRLATGSDHSVTFTKGDGIVAANGTATGGDAKRAFINRTDALPSWMIPGETLHISVNTSDTHLRFCVSFYDSSNNRIGATYYLTGNRDVLIPSNTTSVVMYLNVQSGVTVTNATIRIMAFRSPFVLKSLEALKQYTEYTDYGIAQLSHPQTVDGYIHINLSDWEIGGVGYNDHVITYVSNNKRLRTKQDFGYTVHSGDVIGLFDYTELCVQIFIKKRSDGIIYNAGVKTQDYVVPQGSDGIAYLVVYKQSDESIINNVYEYLSQFFIKRFNSVVSDVGFTSNVGRQFAINHQYGTPVIIDSSDVNNIIACGKNLFRTPHGLPNYTNNGITKTFNEKVGTIIVSSKGATGASVAPTIYDNVNGVPWNCMYKFKLKSAANVVITANADKDLHVYGDIYIQLYDGAKIISIYNEPMVFKAAADTEYGLRIYTSSSYAGTVTLKPQIEIGVTYPTEFEPFKGIVVDENGDSICINTASESLDSGVVIDSYKATVISYDDDVTINYDKVTDYDHGFMLYNLKNKKPDYRQPMLSIIDDDTVNTTYVQTFHDAMEGLGIVGNYAAITKRLTDSAALKDMLLNYEAEGFGVLLHCYYQYNEDTDYFRPGSNYRDIDGVRENIITGLREIKGFGFISGNCWATPYGVNDDEIKAVAKSLGIKAVISGLNDTPNLYDVTDRYSIGRYSISSSSYTVNVPVIKRGMDACISNGGWVIITTHAYEWGDATADILAALSEIVTYANTIGMKVVNFQEGFETYF